MSETYDREAARDEAVRAVLPLVPAHGWTMKAVRLGAGENGTLLFPGGPPDLVEAYLAMANRDMARAAAPLLEGMRLTQRVRTLIAVRLEQAAPHREAVRHAVGFLARPSQAALAARCTARTVDAIWVAAGDESAGFSWYSKRAILAGVYTSTLLFWLGAGRGMEETLGFLDRRLAGVGRIGKLRQRVSVLF